MPRLYRPRRAGRASRLAALSLAALSALALGACANTVQQQPIPHNSLEGLIAAPYPVFWLGGSFHSLPVSEAAHDPSGSVSLQYGNCLQGGEGGCIPPLRVITSPDNSFVPGGSTPASIGRIRGVPAVLAQHGKTIALATAGVVVDIYAVNARLAAAAAQTLVPINVVGAPAGPLPAALAPTSFGATPLASQLPPPLRPPR